MASQTGNPSFAFPAGSGGGGGPPAEGGTAGAGTSVAELAARCRSVCAAGGCVQNATACLAGSCNAAFGVC